MTKDEMWRLLRQHADFHKLTWLNEVADELQRLWKLEGAAAEPTASVDLEKLIDYARHAHGEGYPYEVTEGDLVLTLKALKAYRGAGEPEAGLTDLEKRMKALCTCPKPGTSSSTDDPMCPLAFPHPWNRSAPNRQPEPPRDPALSRIEAAAEKMSKAMSARTCRCDSAKSDVCSGGDMMTLCRCECHKV